MIRPLSSYSCTRARRPLVLSLLTAWVFPFRVLGCCVNKSARYSLHRSGITAGDTLITRRVACTALHK
jgi:hypothetical protein